MPSRAPKTSPERLASLEARFDAFLTAQAERHAENQERLKALDAGMDTLQKALARYTGFWGAVVLIASAVATLWTLVGDVLRKKLGWTDGAP